MFASSLVNSIARLSPDSSEELSTVKLEQPHFQVPFIALHPHGSDTTSNRSAQALPGKHIVHELNTRPWGEVYLEHKHYCQSPVPPRQLDQGAPCPGLHPYLLPLCAPF